MVRTTFRDLVPEASSRVYEATLLDHNGVLIPPIAVTSLRVTLRDELTAGVVNGRNDQDVLNVNGGTLSAASVFRMTFSPADTASASAASRQPRRATFKLVYLGGSENHEILFTVYNMSDVP